MNSSTNETIQQLFALRYSHSQKCFHQSTLESAINDGLNSFRGYRVPSDWILVGIADSREKLLALGEQLRGEENGTLPKESELPSSR